MATPAASLRLPASVARWLAAKTRSERGIVATLLALVVGVVLWTAVWQPLVRDTAAMRAGEPGAIAALDAGRRMADEITGLARAPAAPATPDARAGLERVLAQQNLRAAVTQLDWQEGRVRVVFAAVDYAALINALEALQRDTQLRPVEATLTARVEPGMVRAEIALAR